MKSDLTQERLKDQFYYDPGTGVFTSRFKRNKWPDGREMGHVTKHGYVQFRVDGAMYMAHRLAWLYMTGSFPKNGTDHINRNRSDNRWVNLREATQSENTQNTSAYSSNKSGFPGVSFHTKVGRWRAAIQQGRKHIHLGYFGTAEQASIAYQSAKVTYHPFSTPNYDMGGMK